MRKNIMFGITAAIIAAFTLGGCEDKATKAELTETQKTVKQLQVENAARAQEIKGVEATANCTLDNLRLGGGEETIRDMLNANEGKRVELQEKKAEHEALEKLGDKIVSRADPKDLPTIEMDAEERGAAFSVSVNFMDPVAGFHEGKCKVLKGERTYSTYFPFRGWQDAIVHTSLGFERKSGEMLAEYAECEEPEEADEGKKPPKQDPVKVATCKRDATKDRQRGFLEDFVYEADVQTTITKTIKNSLQNGADVRKLGGWVAKAIPVIAMTWKPEKRQVALAWLSDAWTASAIEFAATKKVIEDTEDKENDFALQDASYLKAFMFRRYTDAFEFEGVEEKDEPRVFADMKAGYRWSIAEVGKALGHPSATAWAATVAAESAPKAEAAAKLEAKADVKK
ncbi:hypothetical protein FJZ48_03135 [Candidatus Uhrbacteria bacterium]|nr:hypothetical protein [Candidatus Uhrbacteria bacterium]